MLYVCTVTEHNTTNVAGLYAQYLNLPPSSVFQRAWFFNTSVHSTYNGRANVHQTRSHHHYITEGLQLKSVCKGCVCPLLLMLFLCNFNNMSPAWPVHIPCCPQFQKLAFACWQKRLYCNKCFVWSAPGLSCKTELNVREHNRQPKHGSAASSVLCRLLLKMHRLQWCTCCKQQARPHFHSGRRHCCNTKRSTRKTHTFYCSHRVKCHIWIPLMPELYVLAFVCIRSPIVIVW